MPGATGYAEESPKAKVSGSPGRGGEGLALASTGGGSQPPHPIHRLTEALLIRLLNLKNAWLLTPPTRTLFFFFILVALFCSAAH